jgi:hypothetical protein
VLLPPATPPALAGAITVGVGVAIAVAMLASRSHRAGLVEAASGTATEPGLDRPLAPIGEGLMHGEFGDDPGGRRLPFGTRQLRPDK